MCLTMTFMKGSLISCMMDFMKILDERERNRVESTNGTKEAEDLSPYIRQVFQSFLFRLEQKAQVKRLE